MIMHQISYYYGNQLYCQFNVNFVKNFTLIVKTFETLQFCLNIEPGPEVIKLFSCSAELSMKIFLLIYVKMPTIAGILNL